MYHSLFIPTPIEGYLGYSQVLAIMKNLPYTFVCRFLCGCKFSTLLINFQGIQLLDCVIFLDL